MVVSGGWEWRYYEVATTDDEGNEREEALRRQRMNPHCSRTHSNEKKIDARVSESCEDRGGALAYRPCTLEIGGVQDPRVVLMFNVGSD
jgi:hypothetical protein